MFQISNKSFTFPFENRKNIDVIALSPDGNVLISVDEDGRALLVNARRGVVLHHFNFQKQVRDIEFSPDGKYVFCFGYFHMRTIPGCEDILQSPMVLMFKFGGHQTTLFESLRLLFCIEHILPITTT